MDAATAALIDYAATIAFSKLGRDATAMLIGTWKLEGKSDSEALSLLQAEVLKSENAAQEAINRLP